MAAVGSSAAPISRIAVPPPVEFRLMGARALTAPPLPKAFWFRSERIDRPPLVLLDTVTSPGEPILVFWPEIMSCPLRTVVGPV